jgi:hypothetical protein
MINIYYNLHQLRAGIPSLIQEKRVYKTSQHARLANCFPFSKVQSVAHRVPDPRTDRRRRLWPPSLPRPPLASRTTRRRSRDSSTTTRGRTRTQRGCRRPTRSTPARPRGYHCSRPCSATHPRRSTAKPVATPPSPPFGEFVLSSPSPGPSCAWSLAVRVSPA